MLVCFWYDTQIMCFDFIGLVARELLLAHVSMDLGHEFRSSLHSCFIEACRKLAILYQLYISWVFIIIHLGSCLHIFVNE